MIKQTLLAISLALSLYAFDSTVNNFINKQNCDQILLNNGYFTTCYSYKYKGAKYVTYTLDGALVNEKNIKKRPRFYSDLNIPKRYRSNYSDYTRNPYSNDRGHLFEDASADYSQKSLNAVYVMSNIIPQYKDINRGKEYWAGVERYSRFVATQLGKVNVLNGVEYGNNPRRIGHNQIAVPKAFWKMIYSNKVNFKKCFYFQNNKNFIIGKHSIKDFEVDCSLLIFK